MGSALTLLNNPPSLRVSSATGQNIPASTRTVIQFPSVQLDNYSGWSTATSTYTAPLPGLYLFSNQVQWGTATSTGVRWSGLNVTAGGSTVVHQGPSYQAVPVGPGVSGVGMTGTAQARILALAAGDQVQCVAAQNAAITVPIFNAPRLIGAYMTPQAAAGTVLSFTPPVTGFRFRAGSLAGAALTAALDARIGNDVNFLLRRPYFTGYQSVAQTGFPNTAGFRQITIDTVGAPPRGGNGDSYGGWSAANHWYVSQAAGWYLVIADLYAVHPPSGTAGILTAGIFCSSSGGVTPAGSPDNYQQVYYPTTDSQPPGAFGMGTYYLQPGEYVYPMLSASSWGGTWGTQVSTGHHRDHPFAVFLLLGLELIPRREAAGRSAHGTASEVEAAGRWTPRSSPSCPMPGSPGSSSSSSSPSSSSRSRHTGGHWKTAPGKTPRSRSCRKPSPSNGSGPTTRHRRARSPTSSSAAW